MTEYEHNIYLTICEISLKFFNATEVHRYPTFCKLRLSAYTSGKIGKKEGKELISIIDGVQLIFNTTDLYTMNLIIDFFSLDEEFLYDYQRIVMVEKETYVSGNWVWP